VSQAALKALDLLRAVAGAGAGGLASKDAAGRAGLDKTTASRLLGMLTEQDWLVREPATRLYFAGPRLVEIASVTGLSERIAPEVDELLERLRSATGETVAMHRLIGRLRVCVVVHESHHEVRSTVAMGSSATLDTGASGRAILAFCPDGFAESVTGEPIPVGREDLLDDDLRQLRTHGFMSMEYAEPGGSGVIAAPVFAGNGVFGAVAILGPASRFSEPHRVEAASALVSTCRKISLALGGAVPNFT
jgi:DNA-binding IclR family transcriptional regulator